jgi:hypothetical protein
VAQGAAAQLQETSRRPATIFNNNNPDAVQNRPSRATQFTINQPTRIIRIMTYHWNDGRGTRAAGSIALRSGSGDIHGPWPAIGQPGQGGAQNAYWVVEPNVELPPGTYAVVDSDPATWAQNGASRGAGIARIDGDAASTAVATPNPDTAKTNEQAAAESGAAKPTIDSVPSEAAVAVKPIFEIWNTGPCETTDTATLTIDGTAHVDAFELLYRWRADEKTVDYTVSFKGEKLGSGTLARGRCLAQQSDWCIARAEPGADLVAGSYSIQTPHAQICRNPGSGGRGFVRAYGSRG